MPKEASVVTLELRKIPFLRVENSGLVDPQFTEHELWELSKARWQQA